MKDFKEVLGSIEKKVNDTASKVNVEKLSKASSDLSNQIKSHFTEEDKEKIHDMAQKAENKVKEIVSEENISKVKSKVKEVVSEENINKVKTSAVNAKDELKKKFNK